MNETRHVSEEHAAIGQRLIDTDEALAHIRGSDAQITYLASDKANTGKGRPALGECERVADRNRWAIPADFATTVFEPNCQGMDEEHVARVILHELLHVGIGEGRDGNDAYSVLPHDLEDFRECVDERGAGWRKRQRRLN